MGHKPVSRGHYSFNWNRQAMKHDTSLNLGPSHRYSGRGTHFPGYKPGKSCSETYRPGDQLSLISRPVCFRHHPSQRQKHKGGGNEGAGIMPPSAVQTFISGDVAFVFYSRIVSPQLQEFSMIRIFQLLSQLSLVSCQIDVGAIQGA